MYYSFIRTASLVVVLGALFALLGCSNGSNPVTPTGDPGTSIEYQGNTNLGEFALYLDEKNLEARIEPVTREGAFDATVWANIEVVGLHWDPLSRIWDIDVVIGNPTKHTVYGPWVVFTQTGDQRILDQDGFTYWQISPGGPTIRVPVKAFAKENPQRAMYGHSEEPLHLRIHWPPGWEGFEPLYFFIDVSYPGPRQEPIVEQLQLQPSPIPEDKILTAFVWDWQIAPSSQQVEVYVDLTPIGGPYDHPMYDDGMHSDGDPNDGTFGTSFYAMHPDPVTLTVHADDWESYHFENDIVLGWIPDPCQPMVLIEEGHMGFMEPVEMIIRDQDTWTLIWHELHPNQLPPDIDFSVHQVVVVGLGPRQSSGFSVHIDCVQQLYSPGNVFTKVDYTEEIPGPNCPVLWVITYPYQLVMTPLTAGPGNFFGQEHVYNCPPPECVPQRDLAQGDMSMIHDERWQIIRNQQDWQVFWYYQHQGGPDLPWVDFGEEMVIVGMLGERPSTDWRLNIDCVKIDPAAPHILVEATEVEPGPDCIVWYIPTYPHHFVAVPYMDHGELEVILTHEIDPCEPPPCVDIRPLAHGAFSNITEPVEEMFFDPASWELFWHMHDYMQPPPDVDWSSEYVIALMTGERNTGGYYIEVNCVRLLEDPSYGRVTLVEWTEMIPGPDCIVPQVFTQPYFFFAVPQQDGTRPDFIKHEFVYSCEPPPECQPMYRLLQGFHSGVHEPYTAIIRDHPAWVDFWMWHVEDGFPPEVNFDVHMVVVACLGDRPSTGYEAQVQCVQFNDEDPFWPHISVDYTEFIPGQSCIVEWIITQPFDFVLVPRWDAPDLFNHTQITYECQ